MSEPEITNPEKTEKTKNPKRVEQGKRLAAISRQAKERKKRQQEEFFEPKGSAETEGNKIFFGIGLIGAAFLVYEMFFKKLLNSRTERSEEDEAEVNEAYTEPEEDEEPNEREAVRPPRKPQGKTGSYEPYTMD